MTTTERITYVRYLRALMNSSKGDAGAIEFALKKKLIEDPTIEAVHKFIADYEADKVERIRLSTELSLVKDMEKSIKEQTEAEAEVLQVQPEPLGEYFGWPATGEAEVVKLCRNPAMVMIQFADGKTTSMWKNQRRWRPGDQTRVKLVEYRADEPLYEPVS